jgi:uncharacterized membrane protein
LSVAFWRAGARVALALGYPIAIYCALLWFEPRVIAVVVVVALLLRRPRLTLAFVSGFSWISHAVIIAAIGLALGAALVNDEMLLRLYPAGISLALLAVFALSLWSPPTVIERLARLRRGVAELPADAVRYTRHVTEVWCAFFAANAAIAAWSAVAASREVWALYNGFLAYVVVCVLFLGERVVRRLRFPAAR